MANTPANARTAWVDAVRSTITILVVFHHAALAYTTFATFNSDTYINSTHPVVDAQRWVGLDIFAGFNDMYFMSLMFLIGGLFLSNSVRKKGVVTFVSDRFRRLFLPFLLLGTPLMILAYIPSYILAHGTFGWSAYLADFFTVQQWPVGPPWFLWLLFLFSVIAALLFSLLKRAAMSMPSFLTNIFRRPLLFILFLFIIGWVLYVPVAYNVGAYTWAGAGPFDFQKSRVILYFGYFATGVTLGITGFTDNLFAQKSVFSRYSQLLAIGAIMVFAGITVITRENFLEKMVVNKQLTAFAGWMIYYSLFILSCTLSSVALLSVLRRQSPTGTLMTSLTENAYLIYLVHYVYITWLQFLLLRLPWPAMVKFVIVCVGALVLSWCTAISFRRHSLFRRYL